MKKILVIEDELAVRENLVELLEAEDFQVFCTDNGFIALSWAQENLPDVILCDVMMPEIDGYQVLKELRQVPVTASIPLIFLTAMADRADMRRGMELGADDYLTKPFTREELLGAIASRLSRHETVIEQYESGRQLALALQQRYKETRAAKDIDEN
jgi:DNA-binding response OmpR family regulator